MFLMLKQLLAILDPKDRKNLFFVFLWVMVMAIIESLGVISIMPFLAVLANPNIASGNDIFNKLYLFLGVVDYKQFIIYLGLISLFFIAFSSIFKMFTLYFLNNFSGLQRYKLSSRLLKIYLVQDYDFFISKNSSELVKNILSEIDHLIWSMIHPALFMMSYSIVVIAMVTLLLVNNPVIAVFTSLIIFGFYMIIYLLVKKKLDTVGEAFTIANAERFESCQEALGGIKDVIINQAQNGYLAKFEYHSKQFSKQLSTKEVLSQIPRYVIETVGYSCLIVIALILVLSDKDVSHIFPVLGLYGFAAYRLLPAAQNVYNSVTQIKFSEYIFKKIRKEFELEHKFSSSEKLDLKPLQFSSKIELKDISFSYPNRLDKQVFENFSLTISKNECLGIVGKSGSGKSTLMDILLGLLIPQKGKLQIDGIELNRKNIHLWREMVGYVPQTIFLANKSVAENIAFGVPKHKVKMEMVSLAAKQAQIDEFILNELSNGYDSIVGEHGVTLSGGQRQRIGIARALYRTPQVLFLDEATSALDVETERAVNESIQKLNGQITIIIIAHRESAVEKCQKILNLN